MFTNEELRNNIEKMIDLIQSNLLDSHRKKFKDLLGRYIEHLKFMKKPEYEYFINLFENFYEDMCQDHHQIRITHLYDSIKE